MLTRILKKLLRVIYRPRIRIRRATGSLIHLGTSYGGKTFVDRNELQHATIISVGLGEDASFDVEFAERYGAKVIIVDPTPRSIDYFHALFERIGMPRMQNYGTSGCLPIDSYDLSAVRCDQLTLVPCALWTKRDHLRFYLPADINHVSHSIVNFQNDFRTDTPFIEVESTTPDDLIANYGLTTVPLLKLDIEGAEVAIIGYLLDRNILPHQILVEFDELSRPSASVRSKYEDLDQRLRDMGYVCVAWDGYSDYSYELQPKKPI